ncbi:SWF or SNF family helicase [Streptomyces beihaiensis]|uniref:SWF or SNF family helicase n=1 Tax=Streptomyces beihaiensis TaxID=2984495 RepID=A0ABT3TZV6_9ACTN|nr:SWF or SNF family helicase [Streptomyces beihaiensis]MCX3062602.1 SWF or SNF family helicase [Streptomyces beihaiensis]
MSDMYDEERVFGALPAARGGQPFTRTWWGHAWLKALEDTALDNAQLKAGRRLARAGAVGAVSVRPGRVTAVVADRDGLAHRADVLLAPLGDDAWGRFLDMARERAGHIAALLDRDMPPHLVEDAATAGVELLPGIGDLEPRCDCGGWDHCAHTAALSYQLARLLDEDPFVLLLLRGRGERALVAQLQEPGATDRTGAAQAPERPEGVDAAEAYACGLVLPALPEPPTPPPTPGRPPSLDTAAPAPAGTDVAALEFLGARAAAEARSLLVDALAPEREQRSARGELTTAQDAVRLAAAEPEAHILARLAEGSGRSVRELALAVRAWRYGGADALAALEEEHVPDPEAAARARAALDAAWDRDERPVFTSARNRWTVFGAPAQLRLGPDGRWWPYREEEGLWTPAGPGTSDPASALATAVEEAER